MKRTVSWLLCICMMLSFIGATGLSISFALGTELDGTSYKPLFDSADSQYENTLVVNPSWSLTSATEGSTDLTIVFRGVSITEKYDADRHFSSVSDALAAWKARYTSSGALTKDIATAVPNIVLAAGTYSDTIEINFSANIYGAQAGVTPNDPSFDVTKALPTDTWAVNSDRTGTTDETIISGGIKRTNMVDGSATDTTYDALLKSASVTTYTLNIDGVKITSETAIHSQDLVYTTGESRYNKINVSNTIFEGNKYGLSAKDDSSRNYNDYTLTNIRVTGTTDRFIYMYPRYVTIKGSSFSGMSGFVYGGGTLSSTNDLWWQSTGTDRSLVFDVQNSVFAKNSAGYIFRFIDNCFLEKYSLTFTNNLFNDAQTANYGVFQVNTYTMEGRTYTAPTLTCENNIFYSSTVKKTLVNGNPNYQKNVVNYIFNNNRIIGWESPFQNITAEMDTFLGSCNWNYDNNYYAKTFTSASDVLGAAPVYVENTATVQAIDISEIPFYLDYNMTISSEDFEVTGSNFTSEVDSFIINNKKKTITIVLKEGTTVNNPQFTVSEETAGAFLYVSETDKTDVTSISFDAIGEADEIEYYLEIALANYATGYTVIVQKWKDVPAFSTDYSNSTITNAALLLPDTSYASGTTVVTEWDGASYKFTVGTDAFDSVNEAISKGFTQMILPAMYEYSNAINITGSIELYGEDFETNPNVYAQDELEAPTVASAWTDGNETLISGNIVVTYAATPSSSAGTTVLVKGVKLSGCMTDTARSISAYKTDITFENFIHAFDRTADTTSTLKIFDLANANSKNTASANADIDAFTLKNGRMDFENSSTNLRMFNELSPANFTIDGVVFADNYISLGYPKWQNSVSNGTFTIQNCYFANYNRGTKSATGHFEGHASNCDTTGKTTKFIFKNNIVIDSVNKAYNSDSNHVLDIYPGAFTSTEIVGNTFVDTNNYYGRVVNISTSKTYAPFSASTLDTITFDDNSVVGLTPFITVSGVTGTVKTEKGNFYARYADGFKTDDAGEPMYGYLAGSDYYVDYYRTTLASDMNMVINRDLSMVNHVTREASFVIEENETYVSDIKTTDGKLAYSFYEDEDCAQPITSITKDNIGGGKNIYAKATSDTGVSVMYRVYVSVGSLNATEPAKVGTANIESPYLMYVETDNMPVGTKFVMTWQGTDYVFTAGTNAFASVSQITDIHSRSGKTTTPNVILPPEVHNVDAVVTKTVNFYGESASSVLTSEPDSSSAVKIACVGDSITEGHGISESLRPTSSYPAQLQTLLDSRYGEGAYEVSNFGFGGSTVNIMSNRELGSNWTYWTYIYTVQYYQSIDYNPDIVVIMMGHNDTHNVFYTTPETYKQRYQALIDTYTALPSHPTVVIAGCTGRAASIRQDYLTQTIIPIQKQLASENNLTFIDMYTPTIDLVSDTTYFVDGLHGSVTGYGLIAELIADGMSHLLVNSRTYTKTDVTVDASKRVTPTPKTKIACIGDSLTYGDKSYAGYPVYLQEMLGDSYEVRNFGECGAIACDESTYTSGTNWCYKHFKRYTVSKEWKPDIVIMMLGFNDQGSHLTSSHSVNWTGGASSTAAAEFTEDYKALVQEYVDLGATVYCVSAPSDLGASATGTANAYINPIIKQTAADLGLNYFDIWSVTNQWGADMYCGTNSTGTTDNTHFSAKGYEAVAQFMFDNMFSDFKTYFKDSANEITTDAVVVDLKAPSHESGDTVVYSWEGNNYTFTWGKNAFQNVNAAIAWANAENKTSLQILIPENDIGTTLDYTFSIGTDISKIESIEVFGQNRLIDPNDRSAASTDPAADWTRNKNWDKWSENGGTSAIARIEICCSDVTNNVVLAGKLKFKGVTLRNIIWNSERAVGTASDPRSLDLIFKNCLVDFTAASTSGGYLFNMNSDRGKSAAGVVSDDSLTLKNFRIERYWYKDAGTSSAKNRILSTWNSNNNNYFDGFYYNGDYNEDYPLGMFGWFQNATANTKADTVIENSNFRNSTITLNVAPIANNVVSAGKSTVYHVNNNVFYNTTNAIAIYAKYYTDLKIEGNYFISSSDVSPITINGTHTATDVNYKDTIGYSAENNTFVYANTANLSKITLNSVTTTDLTGIYLATYADGYQTAISGTAPTVGTADYYYLDYKRNVKNTDFVVTDTAFGDEVEDFKISGKIITANAEAGKKITDTGVTCGSPLIKATYYSDSELTTAVTALDMSSVSANETTKTFYLVLSYGDYSEQYTVIFTLGTPGEFFETYEDPTGEIQNTAVALIPSSAGLTKGDAVLAVWHSQMYAFEYGVNAFASMEEINTAFGSAKLQIILPAGNYTQHLTIYGSWSVYGEGYDQNPNTRSGDEMVISDDWDKHGQTVIDNKNVVIDKAATPTSEAGAEILVSGIVMTRYYNDANRDVSNFKTKVTLKNCVYDRKYLTGNSKEFNLTNANNTCTDTAYTNIDEFNIINMHFINRSPSSDYTLIHENWMPFSTIDGFVCNDNAPSFGYPKVTSTAKKTSFTLTNCFIRNMNNASSRFDFFASFSGHTDAVSSADRKNYDSTLSITNNTFINCGKEDDTSNSNGYARYVLQIFPQSYNTINVTGNEAISTKGYDYPFLNFATISYSENSGDYSDNITFKNNRLIGLIPAVTVNSETEIDLSENYFAKYTTTYNTAALGDTPADTDADYYLDYAMTTKVSDLKFDSNLAGFGIDTETHTAYGFANEGEFTFELASPSGKDVKAYATEDCVARISKINVTKGEAVKVYVKVTASDTVSEVYTLYVMGVEDTSDIASAQINPTSIDGAESPAVWYPSLYGAPAGIRVYADYDGTLYGFTTGENVVTSVANMTLYSKEVFIPDAVSEIGLTAMTGVSLHANGTKLTGIDTKKITVACVGDSITQGVGGTSSPYPTQLQTYLGTDEFTVGNYGLSAATVQVLGTSAERGYTVYAKTQYEASLTANPDMVIFALGTNDLYEGRWKSNDEFVESYIDLIRDYQNLPSKPAIYVTLALKRTDLAMMNVRLEENLKSLQQYVAKMVGAEVIDTYTPMAPYIDDTSYFGDKLHPTATGYTILSSTIGSAIRKNMTSVEDGFAVTGMEVAGTVKSSTLKTSITLKDVRLLTGTAGDCLFESSNISKIDISDFTVYDGNAEVNYLNTENVVSINGASFNLYDNFRGGTMYDSLVICESGTYYARPDSGFVRIIADVTDDAPVDIEKCAVEQLEIGKYAVSWYGLFMPTDFGFIDRDNIVSMGVLTTASANENTAMIKALTDEVNKSTAFESVNFIGDGQIVAEDSIGYWHKTKQQFCYRYEAEVEQNSVNYATFFMVYLDAAGNEQLVLSDLNYIAAK